MWSIVAITSTAEAVQAVRRQLAEVDQASVDEIGAASGPQERDSIGQSN